MAASFTHKEFDYFIYKIQSWFQRLLCRVICLLENIFGRERTWGMGDFFCAGKASALRAGRYYLLRSCEKGLLHFFNFDAMLNVCPSGLSVFHYP